jgi:acetylornithine aminotransferase
MALRLPLRARLASCAAVARPRIVRRGFASLPNADVASDSKSAAIVNEHAPYMVATYARPPPVFVRGKGSWLWDAEDRKFLDFTAGIAVNGLGHCDPEFTRILKDQVRKIIV